MKWIWLIPFIVSAQSSLSLNRNGWYVNTKSFNGIPLSGGPHGPLVFDFTTFPSGTIPTGAIVRYLYTDYKQPLQSTFTITLTTPTTSGSPVYDWHTEVENDCTVNCLPASARPFFWVKDSVISDVQYDRWWSDDIYYNLQLGQWEIHNPDGTVTYSTGSVTIPLDPARWSSVFGVRGTDAPNDWAAALANPLYVGLTFGGGYFFSHGVYIQSGTGTAQFQLSGYTVQ